MHKVHRKTFTAQEKIDMHKFASALPEATHPVDAVSRAQAAYVPVDRRQVVTALSIATRLLASWERCADARTAPILQLVPTAAAEIPDTDDEVLDKDTFLKCHSMLKSGLYLVCIR